MRNGKEMGKKWEMNGKAQKTDSQERPSALDNKNLNSYYRIIEIILIISEVKGVIAPYGRWGVKTIVFLA